ncbi:hypothetical protein [uncultured Xanthomonas sp.]|uniref:hypothetical protein n=1 Tax=uncultured Xanthomonas sp. TaxID=152831 RepID=UPI0025D5FE6A|nr:hypothetical protein [uncultured Xanthomonas sp.]
MIPAAGDMAKAVRATTKKLIEAEILDAVSYEASEALYAALRSQKGEDWQISVPRDSAFVFLWLTTNKGIKYRPMVSVHQIMTDSCGGGIFKHQDISLQMSCVDNKNHARWHFDRANQQGARYQDGPLYHLQFGGHMSGQIEDFWLKEPRWAHAPMDLILLLEAVAANFYTDKWSTKVRRDPTWCEYVSQSERLCLGAYVEKVQELINSRKDTVLSGLWANVS